MLPPIIPFIPFHPSRVEFLRRHREKMLAEKPRVIKLSAKENPTPARKKSTRSEASVFAGLSTTLSPETQAALLAALGKRKKK